jgi:hypothetical protein
MDKHPTVDWIQMEFFGGYWGGHYTLRFMPDGTIEYFGDLSRPLSGHHAWRVSSRIYKNLERN